MDYLLPVLNIVPAAFLTACTCYQLRLDRGNNYRVILFTWMLFIVYMPVDSFLKWVLSSQVYTAITLIIKIAIVFTVTDTSGKLVNMMLQAVHPQILFGIVRAKVINGSFALYVQITKFYLSFLEPKESLVLRQNMITWFREAHSDRHGLRKGFARDQPILPEHQLQQAPQIQRVQPIISDTNARHYSFKDQNVIRGEYLPSYELKKPRQVHSKSLGRPRRASPENFLNHYPQPFSNRGVTPRLQFSNNAPPKPVKIYYEAQSQNPNRIPVMLQMGTKHYPRLEKYFLQLHNRELLIVSAHGRVFQKHELVQIRPLSDDYYELIFPQRGLITNRTVRFLSSWDSLKGFVRHQ